MHGELMVIVTYSIKREGNPKYWYILFQALDSDKKEIGYQEVEFLPESNVAYLIHIHVDRKYRNNGVAKQIMEEMFRVLIEDMQIPKILIPLYSRDGEKYIKPVIDRYRKKYPNTIIKDEIESII